MGPQVQITEFTRQVPEATVQQNVKEVPRTFMEYKEKVIEVESHLQDEHYAQPVMVQQAPMVLQQAAPMATAVVQAPPMATAVVQAPPMATAVMQAPPVATACVQAPMASAIVQQQPVTTSFASAPVEPVTTSFASAPVEPVTTSFASAPMATASIVPGGLGASYGQVGGLTTVGGS